MIHVLRMFYGLGVGLFIATLGAWKDTTFEPFEIRKFFRSPVVVEIWYLILLRYHPGQSFALLALASAALERLTVETYKAVRGIPPGKFLSPTRDRGWLLSKLRRKARQS